jgi:phage gp36-like protein
MALYTTIAKVRSASGFTDDTKVSDAYITGKIDYAESYINAVISQAYTLPLAVVPGLIEEMATEMAKYALYMDEYGEESENLDKGWRASMEVLYNDLLKIAKREVKLVDDATGDELATSGLTSPSFYPTNASSSETATDSTAPKFTMNQQF